METTLGFRGLVSCITIGLLLTAGPGCHGDDDDADDVDDVDDADDVDDDAGPDGGGGGEIDFAEEPSFAAASQACPPAEVEPRISLTAERPRSAAPDRSRVVFARSAAQARDAARPAPGAPAVEAGRFYLDRHVPRALAAPARVAGVHDRGGAIVVKYRQSVGAIPVFGKEINFVLGRDRALVATTGDLTASPVADGGAAVAEEREAFDRGARSAIAAAARDLGLSLTAEQLTRAGERGSTVEFRPERGHGVTTTRARRTYFDDGRLLVAAFHVEVMGRFKGARDPELRSAVVGPAGEVLFRNHKTHRAEPFAYRAYADPESLEPAISPFCDQGMPHPTGVPDGYVPEEPCAQELVSLIHADIPTADPWLPDDATETSGNNVDAFFHIQTDEEFEFYPPDFAPERDFRAQVTGPREFDYPYDVALAPDDYFEDDYADPPLPPPDPEDPQLNAKIAQAFYLGNYLHDLMYRHGYDEASGNSQADNFGRGGQGGDPLLVHAGSYGTYTIPNADGTSPVLTMGFAFGSQLNRDATLDLMTFAHEWMHTMQHRLIGDSEGLSTSQAGSLGEGWSDFLGLLLATRPAQAEAPANPSWSGAFAMGPYFNQAYCDDYPAPLGVPCNGVDDNYYFGIRRYPFSTDMTKSPLTFRYIANGIELPAGIPQRFWKLRIENAEIHSAGEIWASTLWGCYRALLLDERYTFDEARDRMLDYLVESMKATPLEPTFLEARDALFAVVRATDEQDHRLFREAFAARGMGAGAVSPPRDSNDFKGAIESLRAEGPALSFLSASLDDRVSGDGDGWLDQGEEGILTIRLRNTGFEDLGDTTVRAAAVGGHSDVTDEGEVLASAPGEDITVELPVTLNQASHHELVQFDLVFADPAAGIAPTTVHARFRVHYDVVHTERADSVDDPITQADWFMQLDVPYQETVWARGEGEDGPVYEILGTRLDRGGSLVSPCVLASTSEDMIVRFNQAYQLEPYGTVDVRTAGSDEYDWQPMYFLPSGSSDGVEPVAVDLGRQFAGQWLQIRFAGYAPPATDGGVPGWTIDDIELAGIDNTPFSVIVPQGSGAE